MEKNVTTGGFTSGSKQKTETVKYPASTARPYFATRYSALSSGKGFRYPPILPIVYYEGAQNWTAELHLRDRILMKEIFQEYLPDFTYQVIRIHNHSNEELLSRADEMSLLMLIRFPGKYHTTAFPDFPFCER